ncbi:hypothetical protein EA749_14715 [Acinetobacter radioresistens]|jgi:hypothetical protein|uniref:hypothetical protein n=1 Tax=Acinetobacter radioresistens TaxID=40216 RepID=UPI000277C187|nr:hypothetical protein [Acinetobacter radioresistens]EJO33817.1 putative lipoprotein [Acinetobacter radioresistens WC-A-157]RSO63901.1 hypothetical protein EA749_14715 [Acinetobacter radioresistens]
MFKILTVSLLGLVLLGCGNSESANNPPKPKTEMQIQGAKFSSMSSCLKSIQDKTKLPLKPMTDKPEQVTGFLGDTERQFNCEIKQTGTEGTFVEGWYTEEVEVY